MRRVPVLLLFAAFTVLPPLLLFSDNIPLTPLPPEIIPVSTDTAPTSPPDVPAIVTPLPPLLLPTPYSPALLVPTARPMIEFPASPPRAVPFSGSPGIRLVRAGDVDGLYDAIDAANAGLVGTIYLNIDKPYDAPDYERRYALPRRIDITGSVIIHANGAIFERTIYVDENGNSFADERGVGRGRGLYIAPGASVQIHHLIFEKNSLRLFLSE